MCTAPDYVLVTKSTAPLPPPPPHPPDLAQLKGDVLCFLLVKFLQAWSSVTGQKLKNFRGLLFTSHWLNLQHWTGFYIAVNGNFQGLFFLFSRARFFSEVKGLFFAFRRWNRTGAPAYFDGINPIVYIIYCSVSRLLEAVDAYPLDMASLRVMSLASAIL